LWWVLPAALAGMPMPYLHPSRRMNQGGDLTAYDDELPVIYPVIYAAGIRAVVSLLNLPGDGPVYESAGFAFLCMPVADGCAPVFPQADEFVRFVKRQLAEGRPVAVHCEAGCGRTGTLLAAFLIAQGDGADAAIRRVRSVEKAGIETGRQIQFLEQYADYCRQR